MSTEKNTEPKDQTKRKLVIKELEASVAKLDAQIVESCLLHDRLERKLINRMAELRLQKLLLKQAEDKAAYYAKLAATA